MSRRGYSMVELLVAVLVASMVFITFLTVFSSSYRQASQTRNRAIAILLARSLLDEVENHPYGAHPPARWLTSEERPVQMWIQGRPATALFHKKFTYRNGSFVTPSRTNDTDTVRIAISWNESVGDRRPITTGVAGDNREIEVTIPVWR